MFTGLIEHIGAVTGFEPNAEGGARLRVDLGPLSAGIQRGDSIAIDGCCLTVVRFTGVTVEFDAVPETLRRTTLGNLKPGARVNLERALLPTQRLGGHFVQGHVDGTAVVRKTVANERWSEWHLVLDNPNLAPLLVEKGSVALDGISLTVVGCDGIGGFWVALIPETLARTTIGAKQECAAVNVETDILGKYILAHIDRRRDPQGHPKICEAWLKEQGY